MDENMIVFGESKDDMIGFRVPNNFKKAFDYLLKNSKSISKNIMLKNLNSPFIRDKSSLIMYILLYSIYNDCLRDQIHKEKVFKIIKGDSIE